MPRYELDKHVSGKNNFDENVRLVLSKTTSPKSRLALRKLDKSVQNAWKRFYSIATEKNTSHLSSYKDKLDAAYAAYQESITITNQWLLIARLEA